MSIRGRGRHTVIVQPRKVTRIAGMQQIVNDGDPVVIKRCSVQSVREWASAEEFHEAGLQLNSMRRMFAREWVGDVYAHVYFDGGVYEVLGTPQHMDQTPRTEHWVITIRWLHDAAPPVLPDTEGDDDNG